MPLDRSKWGARVLGARPLCFRGPPPTNSVLPPPPPPLPPPAPPFPTALIFAPPPREGFWPPLQTIPPLAGLAVKNFNRAGMASPVSGPAESLLP